MPTTSDGEFVYAEPADVEEYVQTGANQFSLGTNGSPSEWRQFLEGLQVKMKARIDEYCDRDFEDHASDTVVLDGGSTPTRIVGLPSPVRSVTSVTVDETDESTTLDAGEFAVKDGGHLIRVDEPWPTGYQNITVELDWGYQSPPDDVQDAEQMLVANTVAKLAQMREGQVVQQGDMTVQVALPSAMTAEVRGILGTHRDNGRTAGLI